MSTSCVAHDPSAPGYRGTSPFDIPSVSVLINRIMTDAEQIIRDRLANILE